MLIIMMHEKKFDQEQSIVSDATITPSTPLTSRMLELNSTG